MSTTTTNQGLVLPTSSDLNDVPGDMAAYNDGVEPRLVQRFESSTDRSVRNGTPDDGELSYLEDATRYEGRISGQWVTVFSGAAWTVYTPTWSATSGTQPTLGNGSLVGRYQQIGKTVHVFMQLTIGSTSTLSVAQWQLDLPVTAVSGSGLVQVLSGRMWDASATQGYIISAHLTSGTTARLDAQTNSSGLSSVSANGPITWAAGDWIVVQGTYEAA